MADAATLLGWRGFYVNRPGTAPAALQSPAMGPRIPMHGVKRGMPAGLPAPPIEPMLAKIAEALPAEPGFLFEPKWDGFRALVFRGNEQTYLQSRDLRPLNRYFPDLEKSLNQALHKG